VLPGAGRLSIQVQAANSDRLLERGNVVGTGVGRDSPADFRQPDLR
jgi:hypothetical protein